MFKVGDKVSLKNPRGYSPDFKVANEFSRIIRIRQASRGLEATVFPALISYEGESDQNFEQNFPLYCFNPPSRTTTKLGRILYK